MRPPRAASLILVALLSLGRPAPSEGAPYRAFSLAAAESHVARGGHDAEATTLAGINVIAGMVIDDERGDVIVVGQSVPGQPQATLDDLVVALRALVVHQAMPLVSIDPTAETPSTGLQAVRFEGGIADTQLGADLLAADVLLKEISLGIRPSGAPGIQPYITLAAAARSAEADDGERTVVNRFWFNLSRDSALVERQGVFAIRTMRVVAETELLHSRIDGRNVATNDPRRDQTGTRFAELVSDGFETLSASHPELARLRTLFSIVALASGLRKSAPPDALRYWLEKYPVRRVATPVELPFHSEERRYRDRNGREGFIEVSGGIELKAILLSLQAGDVTALRRAVLRSRPAGDALSWRVPIEDWRIPWASGFLPEDPTAVASSADDLGFSLRVISAPVTATGPKLGGPSRPLAPFSPAPMPKLAPPAVLRAPTLPYQGDGRVGGVLLVNTARVAALDERGPASLGVDGATGSLNLLVGGERVDLDQADLRRFVTALWAVYFGAEPPGLSIDPIASEAAEQQVRLIGEIHGSALAKAMLDADYFMKRAAAGDLRPAILGFRSIDDLVAEKRGCDANLGRRFWFVPEDMRFRRAGDALIFDGGRMTVRTEKLMHDPNGRTDECDRLFAEFLTNHYWELAADDPVYAELFDYARLVALASYLKQSGSPLEGFLLENRDLVLRAVVPDRVATVRAPSQHMPSTQWVGGVDLAVDMSPRRPGRYVEDQRAEAALRKTFAARSLVGLAASGGDHAVLRSSAVELDDAVYHLTAPGGQADGTSRGDRPLHTDLAPRPNGEPGVELIRAHLAPGRRGLFGIGWDLYLPYAVGSVDQEKVEAAVDVEAPDGTLTKIHLTAPKRMVVVDRRRDQREDLAFDAARLGRAAWVPKSESSAIEGLVYRSDGTLVLREKSGVSFLFDEESRLAEMRLSDTHRVHIAYEGERPVGLTDASGNEVRLRYDGQGHIVRAEGPAGAAEYSYLGDELVRVRRPGGQVVTLVHRSDGSLADAIVQVPSRSRAMR